MTPAEERALQRKLDGWTCEGQATLDDTQDEAHQQDVVEVLSQA